jgi:predicted metal-dependent phosphoesterase TrpH
VRIDLHTHSSRSDGTDSPGDLVRAAAATGLDVVALTDHDTSAGWAEAASAAAEAGVDLVPGMEISCKHRGSGVHLLAYWPDPSYPPLVRLLAEVVEGRSSRMPRMVERLRELGHAVTVDDVLAQAAGTGSIGRPHIADALVAKGIVESRDEAFDRFLRSGGPAYVDRPAALLEETIRVVADAGGVTVVAHPWGRDSAGVMQPEDLGALQQAGLTGVEVDHEDHSPEQRVALRAVARELGLVVTGSSDHHGAGKVGHDLGCNLTAPEEYARLREARPTSDPSSGSG